MRKLYFWEEWIQPYKNIYWIFFVLFIGSLLYAIYNYFVGIDSVIQWESIGQLDQLKVIAYSISSGTISFDVPVDNYVVFQYFEGSNLMVNPRNGYIYLLSIIIALNLIMAVLPSMPKSWFYAGMGGFIGFVALLNIDQIMLFGQMDKTGMIIVLGLYLFAGYFFKEIKKEVNIWNRFLIFCLISLLIGVLFFYFAGVPDPFLYIANYGIFATIIVSILFIFFIAHEIIYGFLYLITSANTIGSKNSIYHFVFISLLYLGYVWITYMHYTRQIKWDLVYLDPFLLAGITFVIGVWGYKKREELFQEIFSFYPVGALFYLGFGIITIHTISYIFASANDPLIETFEDVVLFSQFGFGIMFFIYILTNFGPLLLQNMKVSKVVYRSRIFPFFVFRISGLLVFGFIVYNANFLPYFQSMAGYYNYIGDLFMTENKLDLAEEYYTEASDYEFQNHRSNYAMASLARMRNDKFDEAFYFRNAQLKKPSAFSYINLSNIYLRNDQYFDGMFELKDALIEYPGSYHILNNLGYFYSRTDITDSSFLYFDMAYNNGRNNRIPASNIYGLLTKAQIDIPLDSIQENYPVKSDYSGRANVLAMKNQFEGFLAEGKAGLEPVAYNFDVPYFAFVYNTGLSLLRSDETAYFDRILDYADSSGIDMYINRIRVLSALNKYLNHQVAESFRLLYELGEMSVLNDEYFNTLGVLALGVNSPVLAVDYFKRTSTDINDSYRLNLAIATAEAGMHDQAESLFLSLEESEIGSVGTLSKAFIDMYASKGQPDVDAMNDEECYRYFHYVHDRQDVEMTEDLLSSVQNDRYKQLMLLEQAEYLLREQKYEDALAFLTNIDAEKLGKDLAVRYQEIRYWLAVNGFEEETGLAEYEELNSNHPFYLYDQLLYANHSLQTGDTVALDSVYERLATWNPFFEEGVIAAVEYFSDYRKEDNYGYNLLVNALTVNLYSLSLNKYYIDYCLKEGLIDFARNRLEFMRSYLNDRAFEAYAKEIDAQIRRKELEIREWGS